MRGLDKNFPPSFRKSSDSFSVPVTLETWVTFKIVWTEFPKADAKWKKIT